MYANFHVQNLDDDSVDLPSNDSSESDDDQPQKGKELQPTPTRVTRARNPLAPTLAQKNQALRAQEEQVITELKEHRKRKRAYHLGLRMGGAQAPFKWYNDVSNPNDPNFDKCGIEACHGKAVVTECICNTRLCARCAVDHSKAEGEKCVTVEGDPHHDGSIVPVIRRGRII